jgi:hypothetical protein
MSYVQHTDCVSVEGKVYPGNPVVAVVLAAIATLLAGGGLTPYTAIPLLLIIIEYCRWWLYDRLVCLGGDRCAIGLLGVVEPPEGKSGFDRFDTDYSINLVLAPHQYQELPLGYLGTPLPPVPPMKNPKEWAEEKYKEALHRQIADDGMQGVLIKETHTTGDRRTVFNTKRYDFEGYFSIIGGWSVKYTFQPYLHCEFEGGGVFDLKNAAELALYFAIAAAVACSIPVIGWIACAILSAVAALITLVGIFEALNDKGSPSVYDPATGQTSSALHPGQDILFVKGSWVFDTAHQGWNELHPIKHCQLVAKAVYSKADVVDWDQAIAPYMVGLGRWQWDVTDPAHPKLDTRGDPAKPADWTNWVQSWCDHVATASTPLTVSNQARPENQWQAHPAIDGCRPEQDDDDRGPDIR